MFNGLIREIAKVQSYQNNTLSLKAKYRPNLGDSIAVNGACLSVTKLYEGVLKWSFLVKVALI